MLSQEQENKRKEQWSSFVIDARNKLTDLENKRIEFNENQKKEKEQIILELARKLENSEMPTFLIRDYVVEALDGYSVSDRHIRRVLRRKYKAAEESSRENLDTNPDMAAEMSEIDDKNEEELAVTNAGQEETSHDRSKITIELKKKLDSTEQELRNVMAENDMLKSQQPIERIPENIVVENDKIGLIQKDHLSTLSEDNKRGYGILVGHYGEVIRRRLEKFNGVATIRFYINVKDASNNIQYLVPVNFNINFDRRATSLTLDEARI